MLPHQLTLSPIPDHVLGYQELMQGEVYEGVLRWRTLNQETEVTKQARQHVTGFPTRAAKKLRHTRQDPQTINISHIKRNPTRLKELGSKPRRNDVPLPHRQSSKRRLSSDVAKSIPPPQQALHTPNIQLIWL